MRAGRVTDTAQAVLLDMDGTLIRSEHVHRTVWRRFFTAWGRSRWSGSWPRAVTGLTGEGVEKPGPRARAPRGFLNTL